MAIVVVVVVAEPPVALASTGATITDSTGKTYIDAAGGAIVVNVGHGRASIGDAMADQVRRLAYPHGSAFTTGALGTFAGAVWRVRAHAAKTPAPKTKNARDAQVPHKSANPTHVKISKP